jgi:hypothetical protein
MSGAACNFRSRLCLLYIILSKKCVNADNFSADECERDLSANKVCIKYNSWIPQENLHAGLNLSMQRIDAIQVKSKTFVG